MLIETEINGVKLRLKSDGRLFSPKSIDAGTLAMLTGVSDCFDKLRQSEAAGETDRYKVLDLGCGYGVVGIYLAKKYNCVVFLSDIDETAVELAKENCQLNGVDDAHVFKSDGFSEVNETGFNAIMSNPPYHTDFSVAKSFIEKGFNRLVIGGSLFMVTKRYDWYKNKLTSVFGGVKIREIDGYYVFCAEKRSMKYVNR